MPCLGCAELRNKVEELQRFIHLRRSQIIHDVKELAANPDVTQDHVLEILLRYVKFETDRQSPDLACPESGCNYLADTYQLLQRHYLSHVFYQFPCPFCSRKLYRVSQVDSHLGRCSSRDRRVIPEKFRKRKLDAYSQLQRAQKNKKRRVLALSTSNFSTALNPAIGDLHLAPNTAPATHSLEESWQQMEGTGHSGIAVNNHVLIFPLDQQSTLFGTTQQDSAPGLMRELPSAATTFSPTKLFPMAPGLVNNFAAGSTLSNSHGQASRLAQHSFGNATPSASKQLYSNPDQELAPGLIDNFADGATTFPSIQQDNACLVGFTGSFGQTTKPSDAILHEMGRAPGLIDNFADGTATHRW